MATNSKISYIFVAISFVSTALLYVYFKNKVSRVDEKLDMMYQLIQSHAVDNEMVMQENIQMRNNMNSRETSNLIEVSENETLDSDNDSDNSDDDSSDEDNTDSDNDSEQLVLGENMELGDVKKIELNLDVAENEEYDTDITLKKINDVTNQSLEEKHDSDTEVQPETNNIEVELSEEADEVAEEVAEEVTDEVAEELDYTKLRVVELKSICRNRKLTNYAGLKKAELIELLMSS